MELSQLQLLDQTTLELPYPFSETDCSMKVAFPILYFHFAVSVISSASLAPSIPVMNTLWMSRVSEVKWQSVRDTVFKTAASLCWVNCGNRVGIGYWSKLEVPSSFMKLIRINRKQSSWWPRHLAPPSHIVNFVWKKIKGIICLNIIKHDCTQWRRNVEHPEC